MTAEEIAKFLANLAAFAVTPVGQQLIARLSGGNAPSPAELHAAIAALPVPAAPKGPEPEGKK